MKPLMVMTWPRFVVLCVAGLYVLACTMVVTGWLAVLLFRAVLG